MPNLILGKVKSSSYEHGYTLIHFIEGSTRTVKGKTKVSLAQKQVLVYCGPRDKFSIYQVLLIGAKREVKPTLHLGGQKKMGGFFNKNHDSVPLSALVTQGLEIAMPLVNT